MYILSGSKKEIINSEFVERFCISVKPDAALVIASYSDVRPPVTIARYANEAEAMEVLAEMLLSLAGDQRYYTMPESRLYAEEPIKKDARTRRKGGS